MAEPLEIRWPYGGLSEGFAYSAQPPNTTVDALNCLTFDQGKDRGRGGVRFGTRRYLTSTISGATPIQDINSVTYQVAETRYDPLSTPTLSWSADPSSNQNMRAVAVDGAGFVYVAGVRGGGKCVYKYTSAGVLSASYDAGGTVNGLALFKNDTTPNVVIVMNRNSSWTGSGAANASILVLSNDLSTVVSSYDHAAAGNMMAVATDGDNNIYVTGDRTNSLTVWKFTSALSLTSDHNLGAGINGTSIAVSSDRAVCVTGNRTGGVSVWRVDSDLATTTHTYDTGANTNAVIWTETSSGSFVVGGVRSSSLTVWRLQASDLTLLDSADTGANRDVKGLAVDYDRNIYCAHVRDTLVSLTKFTEDLATTSPPAWTYDSGDDALAVSVGVAPYQNVQVAGEYTSATTPLRQLTQVDVNTVITQPRTRRFTAISGGDFYRFDQDDNIIAVSGGTDCVASAKPIFGTEAAGKYYFCDGQYYRVYDPTKESVAAWAATAGSLPDDDDDNGTADTLNGCTLIELWRNRIVMSGSKSDPQNWFMSAVGSHTDFDYSPATQTATQAVAGNSSEAGRIGKPVTAIIPYADDLLILGTESEIWRMTGDPMDGGRLDKVGGVPSGVAYGRAWCIDPDGWLYFFGTQGGMYRMAPGGIPESMSNQRIQKRFADIDLDAYYIRMAWLHKQQGVLVTLTRISSTTSTHYFWDKRADAWWPQQFASTSFDPICMFPLDGDASSDRVMLFGCKDGRIRKADSTVYNDDILRDGTGSGTAINTYCYLGPLMIGGDREIKVNEFMVMLGETSANVTYTLLGADTPELALSSPTTFASGSNALVNGRNVPIKTRGRAHAIYLKLGKNASATDNAWSLEKVKVRYSDAGRARQR